MEKPVTLVLFGATGDLALKKLFPALASLFTDGVPHKDSRVIAVSRRNFDTEAFHAFLKEQWPEVPDILLEHLEYADVDFDVRRGYENLKAAINTGHDLLIYLSLAPQWFSPVIKDLHDHGILLGGKTKLLLEKPFGTDEDSARSLNALLLSFLRPEQIYRIDHYLGKTALQALMDIHERSTGLRDIISNKTVASITVKLLETKGIDGRAAYDSVGAFRDVGQNHMLEALAVLMAEYPKVTAARAWQEARAAVLFALTPPMLGTLRARRGQYAGYLKERGVHPESNTETAFEIETSFDEGELSGIPVTLTAGKCMAENYAGMTITFKDIESFPAALEIVIQPEPQCIFRYKDGSETATLFSDKHDAYYHVLSDALTGETKHFVGEDEILASWHYTDALVALLKTLPLQTYSKEHPF